VIRVAEYGQSIPFTLLPPDPAQREIPLAMTREFQTLVAQMRQTLQAVAICTFHGEPGNYRRYRRGKNRCHRCGKKLKGSR